jgi:hypothetical protein
MTHALHCSFRAVVLVSRFSIVLRAQRDRVYEQRPLCRRARRAGRWAGVGGALQMGFMLASSPAAAAGEYLWQLMSEGLPALLPNGSVDSSVPYQPWRIDQEILQFAFAEWFRVGNAEASPVQSWHYPRGAYPKVQDTRHGYLPDLRLLPRYAALNETEFAAATRHAVSGLQLVEGFDASLYDPARGGGVLGRGPPGLVWHALGALYGATLGSTCQCGRKGSRGMDAPGRFFTMHFTCIQQIHKPAEFASEADFMRAISRQNSCVRHYYLAWHAAFRRSGQRLPPPRWDGPPVVGRNRTYDKEVGACFYCQCDPNSEPPAASPESRHSPRARRCDSEVGEWDLDEPELPNAL